LGIFFSVLLVVVQPLSGIASAAPSRKADQPCKCCNCGGTGCCVTESTPAPQPLAACPGLGNLQLTEFLFLQCPVSEGSASSLDTAGFFASPAPSSRAPALPLFLQFCSFLI